MKTYIFFGELSIDLMKKTNKMISNKKNLNVFNKKQWIFK